MPFHIHKLRKSNVDMNMLQYNRAAVCLNLTDMRGLSEQVSITPVSYTHLVRLLMA